MSIKRCPGVFSFCIRVRAQVENLAVTQTGSLMAVYYDATAEDVQVGCRPIHAEHDENHACEY